MVVALSIVSFRNSFEKNKLYKFLNFLKILLNFKKYVVGWNGRIETEHKRIW